METLLTRAELAEELGISESMINRLRRKKAIPTVQLGERTFRFVLQDVYEAIKAGALDEPKPAPKPARPKRAKAVEITAENLHEHIELPAYMKSDEGRNALLGWLEYKRKNGKAYKSMTFVALLFDKFRTEQEFIDAVRHSIANNYQGLFAPSAKGGARPRSNADANVALIEKFKREEEPLVGYYDE